MTEKVYFQDEIFKMANLMDAYILRLPEPENRNFSGWSLSVYECVSVSACLSSV